MKPQGILLLFAAVFALGGCNSLQTTAAPEAQDLPSTTPMLVPAQTLTPSATLTLVATIQPENEQETPPMNEVPLPTPLDPGLEKIVTQAKNDLATRLAIDAGQIELLEVASVTWPDGSLGCPQPDMAYTQAQVDGFRIRFGAAGQTYEYHGGGRRAPFLCQQAPSK